MGVCINLGTWKAHGFLAPFRCQTDGLTGALLLPEPHPGPPPNPKKSIVPKRETPNTYPCQRDSGGTAWALSMQVSGLWIPSHALGVPPDRGR